MNWLVFGLLLSVFPRWSSLLLFLGLPKKFAVNFSVDAILHASQFAYPAYTMIRDLGPISAFIVLATIVYRYHHTFMPAERQQAKWFIFGLVLSAGPTLVIFAFNLYYYSSNQYGEAYVISSFLDGLFLLELAAIVASVVLALLRYRLVDVDLLINRALVYGGLITMAGAACLLAIAFIDFTLGQISENQKAFMVIPISAFLFAAAFKPAHFRLQIFVDKYIKPDKFDFAETFFEFSPEMRIHFTLPELSEILATKSVEQLGVAHASVFLKNRNGKLQHARTASISKKAPKLSIESKALSELEKGNLVIPDLASAYSIIIPLVLPRTRKPDFIGALMLGSRMNELGYSTEMKKSLQKLGEEIGKTLYFAQIRKRR